MSLEIKVVDKDYVNQTWPLVEKYISEALTSSPDFPDWSANYTTEHVRAFLAAGNWLLIVAVDEEESVHGACTVSFINYPLHRVAFITSIGGKLVSSKDTFEQLKRILQSYGATKIQGYGRESIVRLWRRLFGFEARNTLVEVRL